MNFDSNTTSSAIIRMPLFVIAELMVEFSIVRFPLLVNVAPIVELRMVKLPLFVFCPVIVTFYIICYQL